MGALRKEFLIVYDIEDNKIRKKLFDRFKDFGMNPIQKSVFWGLLNKAERQCLEREIEILLNKKNTDKVLIIEIDIQKNINTFFIGHSENDFKVSSHGII